MREMITTKTIEILTTWKKKIQDLQAKVLELETSLQEKG